MNCPVCGSARNRRLFKGGFYTLDLCLECRSNFQERSGKPSGGYNSEYFHAGHQKAYGKTYMEDESNIRAFSRRRLSALKRLVPEGGRILDIGSAMGLFCDEAVKMGFEAHGVEISDYARDYSIKRFGIKCWSGLEAAEGPYDAATLWFTIEHIENPLEWLGRINGLLRQGGVIAASVPNSEGAFARFNSSEYYKKRPEEHYFEPSPRGIRIMFFNCGFKVKKLDYFGLHPERLGLPAWAPVKNLQKAMRAGDTFEIYAVKVL